MSKLQKILDRLIHGTGSITFMELEYILKCFGYTRIPTGKTSGSRVAFWNEEIRNIIRIHKPHPGNELKEYQRKMIKKYLEEKGFI